jgi:hypothetical protein
MSDTKRLKVFLCHASTDKLKVKEYYKRLMADKVDAWLDSENLIPGQIWDSEIQSAIRSSHVFIVFLTKNSVSKEGYIQKEIRTALDCAEEKLENSIYIIPALLEECAIPVRLSKYQYADLDIPDGYKKLLKSLHLRAQQVGCDGLTENKEENETQFEDSILPPEGATLHFRNKLTTFSSLENFITEDIDFRNKKPNWSSAIEIQNISVAGVFSNNFFINILTKFLKDYPLAQFKVQYILIKHEYLQNLPLSKTPADWAETSRRTLMQILSFAEKSQSLWGNRLDFAVKTIKALPEKSGTLLNHEHLFFSEVDFIHDEKNMPQMRINQNSFYCSANNELGYKQIALFQNRFNFYWNFQSEWINKK